MANIRDNKNAIIIENSYVKLEISKKDASVTCKDLKTDKVSEKALFFAAFDREEKCYEAKGVTLNGDVATFETELGSADVKIEVMDDHIIFEVVGEKLKDEAYYIYFVQSNYVCDKDDIASLRVAEVPMTINTRTFNYPDGITGEFRGAAYPHLGGVVGAKMAVATVPEVLLRETLKTVCSKIDPEKGMVSKTAGPWGFDVKENFGDYTIVYESSAEYIKNNIEHFKNIGVDQVDIHQGGATFRQGDFKYGRYESHEEFKKNVSDVLAENGMKTGLHTYAYYINPLCHEILSDPKWQKQLDRNETFTLAEDISAEDLFVPSVESTAELSDYYGFFTANLPYILIGEEIIYYTNAPDGFKVLGRGLQAQRL